MERNEMIENIAKGDMLFNFKGNKVEVFVVNGKEYFNMNHVGEVLGIKNINDTTKKYSKFYKVKLTNEILQSSTENSGVDKVYTRKLNNFGESFLTESGLYKVVFRSNKPQAEEFQEWVFCEVLPQIRRTGGYIPVNAQDTEETIKAKAEAITGETIKQKDEIIAQQQRRIEELESYNKEADDVIDILKNDVKYLFNDTDFGVHSISEAYRIISRTVNGQRNFVRWFKEHNELVEVIDVYVDEDDSKIRNAIDLSDINNFHYFKDLVLEYSSQQQLKR